MAHNYYRVGFLVLFCVGLQGNALGGISPSVIGFPFQSALTSPVLNQLGPTQTFTISAQNFILPVQLAVGIAGPNQADFQVSPGGTCQNILLPGSSCTVNVSYKPSTTAQEVAQLQVTCLAQASASAGYVVTCNGSAGKIGDLLGNFIGSIQIPATPALSSGMLTVLALLLFALGLRASIKRERTNRS